MADPRTSHFWRILIWSDWTRQEEVTVQGVVHPRTSGQDVRVDMRGSNGTRGTVTVTTVLAAHSKRGS